MSQLQQAKLSFALAAPLPLFSTRWRPIRQFRFCRYRVMSRSVAVAATGNPRSDDPVGPAFAPPQKAVNEKESLLIDSEDRDFVDWASPTERDVANEPPDEDEDEDDLIDLIKLGDEPTPGSPDSDADGDGDDALDIVTGFEEDEDEEVKRDIVNEDVVDDDEEDEDEYDEEEEEEEEDEELAAQADSEDYEDDIPIATLSKRGGRISTASRMSGPLAAVDVDDNDDVDDADEILETIDDDIPPIFDGPAALEEEVHPSVDEGDEDLFEEGEEESEEDIRSAADILSSSGLLGLGVEGGKREDMSAVTSFAMGGVEGSGRPPVVTEPDEYEDEPRLFDADDEDLEEDELDEDSKEDDIKGLESYKDSDNEEVEDEDFPLTSKSSAGRVWELNDDNYVTITEPGEAYAYELDEEDEEDQEMATMRRGKQGGWSGGLASYSAQDLPEGSPEWVARRAYELVAKSNQVEMFKWTRRHRGPPPIIDELYPADPLPPPRIPRTKLYFSTPEAEASIVGTDSSDADNIRGSHERERATASGLTDGSHALDRAVNFPCQYKFKVEGSGDSLIDSLIADTEAVVGRPVPDSAVHVQPAGRYKRVEITVEVTSAQQVTHLYDTLRSNPGVKYSYG